MLMSWWGGSVLLMLASFSGKFSGPIDWRPRLHSDPGAREGEEGETQAGPFAFSLAQNHPNPFNPTTTVMFSVPDRSHVRLLVYDLAGRQVATLVDRVCEPGDHEAVWYGRNDQGDRVASGVYFLRLEDGRCVSSKKLVLLK
jgi:hypothetical protein